MRDLRPLGQGQSRTTTDYAPTVAYASERATPDFHTIYSRGFYDGAAIIISLLRDGESLTDLTEYVASLRLWASTDADTRALAETYCPPQPPPYKGKGIGRRT